MAEKSDRAALLAVWTQSSGMEAMIYRNFLSAALASGGHVAAPAPKVVSRALEAFEHAVNAQRAGKSKRELVVDLS